jgi:hypothetical protein
MVAGDGGVRPYRGGVMAELIRVVLAGVVTPVLSLGLLVGIPCGLIRLVRSKVPLGDALTGDAAIADTASQGRAEAPSVVPSAAIALPAVEGTPAPNPTQPLRAVEATPESLIAALHALGELGLPPLMSPYTSAPNAEAIDGLVARVAAKMINIALGEHGFELGTRAWASALPAAELAIVYGSSPGLAELN